jgi:hypothetical protein
MMAECIGQHAWFLCKEAKISFMFKIEKGLYHCPNWLLSLIGYREDLFLIGS